MNKKEVFTWAAQGSSSEEKSTMASVAETIVDNAFGSLSTKPRVQVIEFRMMMIRVMMMMVMMRKEMRMLLLMKTSQPFLESDWREPTKRDRSQAGRIGKKIN